MLLFIFSPNLLVFYFCVCKQSIILLKSNQFKYFGDFWNGNLEKKQTTIEISKNEEKNVRINL